MSEVNKSRIWADESKPLQVTKEVKSSQSTRENLLKHRWRAAVMIKKLKLLLLHCFPDRYFLGLDLNQEIVWAQNKLENYLFSSLVKLTKFGGCDADEIYYRLLFFIGKV